MKIRNYCLKTIVPLILLLCCFGSNSRAQGNITISGSILHDANGMSNGIVDPSSPIGIDSGTYNVVLVNDSTNKVVAWMPNLAGGVYSFASLNPAPYSVRITINPTVVGATPPAVALVSATWVNTGEHVGTNAGSDGTPDGILALDSVHNNVSNVNFGIQQRPNVNANPTTTAFQGNPTGVNFVTINNNLWGGADVDGQTDSLRITAFPSNATTFQVNGTGYTAATFPANGLTVPANAAGNISVNTQVDPLEGAVLVQIHYKTIDNAHFESLNTGIIRVPFTFIDGSTPQELADNLTGNGVIVLNPTMNGTCPTYARGMFNFFGPNDINIDSGIVLTNGRVLTSGSNYGINGVVGNFATNSFNAGINYAPGDPDLNNLLIQNGSNSTTNDACVLEFDFVPAGDTVKFDYVFGSEEYPEFACTNYNDVFGFFISGPSLAPGLHNIAIVPGTTIPVAINSINNQSGSACTNMGPGSPFSQYYVNYQGMNGQQITYDGFTTVLTAMSPVSPCDTYHLKLAIADAGDASYDSGVFLKAGSLTSTGISVQTFGGAGMETPFTNTVRGCPPGIVRISRTGGFAVPVTIPLVISGTAVNGVDYQQIPNSVTIPAGDSAVTLSIVGIPMFPAVGPKTVVISAISPYNCGGAPLIYGSDTITILDSIYVKILQPDTAVCVGESVYLPVQADSFMSFQWEPTTGVSNTTSQNTTVTPLVPTTYRVVVSLPNGISYGCPQSSDSVRIDVKVTPQIDLGSDIFTCADSVQLNAQTSPPNPDETFSWTPAAGLNNPNIPNPTAFSGGQQGTTIYRLTVNPGAVGCDGHDSIRVTVLPDHITLLNNDTVVCAGTVIHMQVDGDPRFSYNWAPSADFQNDTIKNNDLIAEHSGTYTVTASYPTCPAMADNVYIEVQPNPVVNVGTDQTICSYDSLHLLADVSPSDYNQYTYAWTPAANMDHSDVPNPVFRGEESHTVVVTVTTPIGCIGKDSLRVIVNPGHFLAINPADTGVCPPGEAQLRADGGATYSWTPELGLSDPHIGHPMASPTTPTNYKVVSTSAAGCLDSAIVRVDIYPNAVVDLPDSVTIWVGEQYQMNPQGNAVYFSWFPPSGLSADNISDPIASPSVRTRYFVTATTEKGCQIKDSIDVLVNYDPAIGVPNAFTPGSGSANGTFKIEVRGPVTLRFFRVYNRWGNLVFETSNVNEGWDGTYKGKLQPNGVYVYMIEAETQDGQIFRKNGNVTLIR